jgi:hypothetical protein
VSQGKQFVDEKAIQTRDYDQVVALLKKHTGAKKIQISNHTTRHVSRPPAVASRFYP